MPILPLPQFEADVKAQLDEQDKAAYEALKTPKTLVVRFGSMKMIGEFQHTGTSKPGCGSKLVVRTFRGMELGEMLTSTCPNSGCSKSVSRQEVLQYVENSGGRDYPFYTEGKVLRVATTQDLDAQAKLEQSKHDLKLRGREVVARVAPQLKLVEVEPILGGECLTAYVMTEERVELRDLARELGHTFRTRVEVRAVGARDEARLTADYEKCGQYCCCKNFLKVLKPVSMKSAKVQKATLDPLKISGRCGRLMCCLRYEDQTYEDLAKRLPRRKSRVGTPQGDGLVLDSQILTQLVLVLLDAPGPDGKDQQIAVPVEELSAPINAAPPLRAAQSPAQSPHQGPPQGQSGPPGHSPRAPRGPARDPLPPRAAPPGLPPAPSPAPGAARPPRPPAPPKPPRDEVDDLLLGDDIIDDTRPRAPRRDTKGRPSPRPRGDDRGQNRPNRTDGQDRQDPKPGPPPSDDAAEWE